MLNSKVFKIVSKNGQANGTWLSMLNNKIELKGLISVIFAELL